MIDFEDTFEGLTISGRANISTKSKPKAKGSMAWAESFQSKLPPPVKRPAPLAKPSGIKRGTRTVAGRGITKPIANVMANVQTALNNAKLASKVTPVSVAIKAAQNVGANTVTPTAILAANKLIQSRTNLATNMAAKAVSTLASKVPVLPAQLTSQIKLKAMEAVAPIAQACKCEAQPVIDKLDTRFQAKGFPTGTATNLLAGLHDMNHKLEKAAVQRLATYEHNAISAEQKFRCKVLKKLSSLSKCLPECHPARTRAHLSILKQV